jgi:hypothetical protein
MRRARKGRRLRHISVAAQLAVRRGRQSLDTRQAIIGEGWSSGDYLRVV